MDIKSITSKFEESLKQQNKSLYTIIAYKTDIDQYLNFCFKIRGKNINEVTAEDIKAFIEDLKNKGYTMKSISRKLNSIRTFSKYALHQKIINDNPSLSITHPKIENKLPRVLSTQEYRALRDVCREDKRLYCIFELLLQTGIKIGELCRLELDDIIYDSKGKIFALRIKKYESNIERDIHLNQVAIKAIEEYLKIRPTNTTNKNIFLTKKGNPILIRNVRFYLEKAFKKAGIKDATVNDIRNTFIAHHLSKGANILIISRMVGHKRVSTTERYAELLGIDLNKLYKLDPL